MKITIRVLTVIIILLPLTEIFLVSMATFIDYSNEWREIKIKKGKHSYYPTIEFIYKLDQIEFYFKPNRTWYYKEPERNGWSKVRGFSKGLHHDQGSARLVYKCINDSLLVVGSYCYVNGIHPDRGNGQQAILDTIYPDRTYHCIIRHEDEKFKFFFEDTYWECPAGENPSWGYMLNPFIGGVYTLEHDWEIEIMDVKNKTADTLHALGRPSL